MKTLAISIVFALGVSAPALAQTNNTRAPGPPPAEAKAEPALDAPLDEALIDSGEDRARLLLRCVGPPPRSAQTASAPREASASEPAAGSNAG